MDVEALLQRYHGARRTEHMDAAWCHEAADALAALSADLSMAQAAAETARNACDHWEARAKELEEDLEMSGHAQTVLANTSSMIRAAESRATALAAEVERLRKAIITARSHFKVEYIDGGRICGVSHDDEALRSVVLILDAALEGKDNG